jgi:hypothetical protein
MITCCYSRTLTRTDRPGIVGAVGAILADLRPAPSRRRRLFPVGRMKVAFR